MLYVSYYIGNFAGGYFSYDDMPHFVGSCTENPSECETSLCFWLGADALEYGE